eukprot:g593.t1
MRFYGTAANDRLCCQIITGTHVSIISIDVTSEAYLTAGKEELLGFLIRRVNTGTGTHWIHGDVNFGCVSPPKLFQAAYGMDMASVRFTLQCIINTEGNISGQSDVDGPEDSLLNYPIQEFRIVDRDIAPGESYAYTIFPIFIRNDPIQTAPFLLSDAHNVHITARSEALVSEFDGSEVHFNNGAAGSQFYAKHFDNVQPKDDGCSERVWNWLGRGLDDALIKFIGRAESSRYALRVALYQATYAPVLCALSDARKRGVDVKLVYDGKFTLGRWDSSRRDWKGGPGYGGWNMAAIAACGLSDVSVPRRATRGIPHNKFFLLLKDDAPVAVWTGSANMTTSGLFGQANVGHVLCAKDFTSAGKCEIRNASVVLSQYLRYWKELARDMDANHMRTFNERLTPMNDPDSAKNRDEVSFAAGLPRVSLLTCPRPDMKCLERFASMMAGARNSIFFTAAFGINRLIASGLLRYDPELAMEAARFVPKCPAHGISCSQWTVKKEGPNVGRRFFTCGMRSIERQCPYFAWVDRKRHSPRKVARSVDDKRHNGALHRIPVYLLLESAGRGLSPLYVGLVQALPNGRVSIGCHLDKIDKSIAACDRQTDLLEEKHAGLSEHVFYCHLKLLLIDPFIDDAWSVVTGSGNFSDNSVKNNDENYLIFEAGNTGHAESSTRIVDIYLTEFMRLFDHFAPRYAATNRSGVWTEAPWTRKTLTRNAAWTHRYRKGEAMFAERKLFMQRRSCSVASKMDTKSQSEGTNEGRDVLSRDVVTLSTTKQAISKTPSSAKTGLSGLERARAMARKKREQNLAAARKRLASNE